ncbi:MAG: acetolactate synthase small subunit [Candidatus Infernicultor aquiphilus]|uniref:Acetolactate synthase small subunit n=1 Tax=Candidatus Infernicultor aquiphilus TaxID=1805029 RepID=A0A1J5GHA4_9BACT|nr:acetolactate synthase small subunit [bacterium]OIP67999.1 MAG: acetolactate synthase small subunit [Candidatus Atribacteria bacterium CG2_30_33_13]PIU25294.1 MAG: acetolactate synthase small subunit [Candidatus Atribacteria bacterium CG08_land_8_20_14_0_20_33_29]PIW12147.1 MAG: acetolactate synthase small subunit [Candidatus Atribacteria bacterium CG17_big_fil_post_rev_8_21_14_2_50_34_11]PIX35149.1 MAG: acetolactate synthase small subunit [Candidatus Atribacteria bacterium CG_4_8_14_3_um_fil
MRHTIAVLVKDHPGVLARVAGLFTRRGFNIESLAVGHTEENNISRMTIVVEGDERALEQITKQLNKLIDVIRVRDIFPSNSVERELALIKVNTNSLANRSEIIQMVDIFRAKIIDVNSQMMTIETTGTEDKVNALIELLKPFGLKEVVRTGKIALFRGSKSVSTFKKQEE